MCDALDLRIDKSDPRYSGSSDKIISVLDRVFEQQPDGADYSTFLRKLTNGQRLMWLSLTFEGEVCNGGFAQYFANSTGDHAVATLQALRELCAVEQATLLERAMSVLPTTEYPADNELRNDLMDGLSEDADEIWEDCDTRYYELDRGAETLRRYWVTYIGNHPDEFFR